MYNLYGQVSFEQMTYLYAKTHYSISMSIVFIIWTKSGPSEFSKDALQSLLSNTFVPTTWNLLFGKLAPRVCDRDGSSVYLHMSVLSGIVE